MGPEVIALLSILIPPLIKFAETAFIGEKRGAEKKAFVLNQAGSAVDSVSAEGVLKPQEVAPVLAAIVETKFQDMKAHGLLTDGKQMVIIRGEMELL